MPVAVQRPARKRDSIETIMAGLQVANTILGIKSNIDRSEIQAQQQANIAEDREIAATERDRLKGTNLTEREKAGFIGKGFRITDTPDSSSLSFTVGEENTPIYFNPPELKKPPQMTESQIKSHDLQNRKFVASQLKDERENEKKLEKERRELEVPGIGIALTKDDAKILKEGKEQKDSFDRKLNELISLRKKYGTEFLNREAVARGKQLSKDLLLTYKNMAKLGVLSQADEKIINAIIPADPLGAGVNLISGQDPILSNLEKFRDDSNSDFLNKIAGRVEDGEQIAESMRSGPGPIEQEAGQANADPSNIGAKPGTIVEVEGKRYRVGADGDELEEL